MELFASENLSLWELLIMADEEREEQKRKPIHGLGLRYHSPLMDADISIHQGVLRKLAVWCWEQKRYIYHGALWVVIGGGYLGGFSIRDVMKINTKDVNALEVKLSNYDEKVVNLEKKVAVLEIVSNEDGKELEKAQKLERNLKRRRELENYNKARAEKLRKIGQMEPDIRANPPLPSPSSAPIRNHNYE
jgi:hypothetical protein